MRPKATWVATAAAFGCCLSACRVEESDSSPISLLERAAPAIATPVALANETGKALSVDLASRLEFDIRIPERRF